VQQSRRRFLALAGGLSAGFVLAPNTLQPGVRRAQAQLIPGSPTFQGAAGTSYPGPITLNPGVTVVRAQYNGTANFAASMILPEPGSSPADQNPASGGFFGLFDQIGAFQGGTAVLVGSPGAWYLEVSSTAAWRISVEQPLPETVQPVAQTTFSGKGVNVSPYFMLPDGISQISMQTVSPFLVAYLFHLDDLGGSAIVAGVQGYDSSIFDFRDPNNQPSFPVSLPDDGPYVLAVTNDIDGQSAWTVSFA
jgi:hypothetical protein